MDVKNLGITGDIVKVSDGYGRNYLIPNRMAVPATDANLAQIEAEKRRRAANELEHVKDLAALGERIQATDITLRERVASGDNLYGAISAKEIVSSLADEGIKIDEDMVQMEEPIKTLGVHRVNIRLHKSVEAELKVWVVEHKVEAEA
jgi:large subunit ribosomal protein L9